MAEEPPQDRPPETGARSKAMRPPNRKKFEEEQKVILEKISAKEGELKSLGKPSKESLPEVSEERSQLNGRLKALRAEKYQTIEQRKDKEQKLHQIRSEITKKGDVLSKLEANLPYRTSESLLKALKNLEYQLQHKRLTSREESRLVREIETLKRSSVKVREYNQKKKDIEADKDRRYKLKEEKDKDFNHVSALKQEEEQVKQRLDAIKRKEDEVWARYREGGDRREQLKAEIDSLYESKRQAVANHKAEQQKYEQYMKEYREGERLRIEEARRAKAAERMKQRKEYDELREPFLEERQTCAALIKYLQSYIPPDEGAHLNSTAARVRHSTESLNQSDLESPAEYTVLRRKVDSDDDTPVRRRKGKRHRRQSGHGKPLRHSNQIFLQFMSLKVDAPPTMSEVVETLVKLRSKLEYLEKVAKDEKQSYSDVSSSHGSSDLAMSDFSAGTSDLLQDYELEISDDMSRSDDIQEEEEVETSCQPQSLRSEVSRDDGIHSLESNDGETTVDPSVEKTITASIANSNDSNSVGGTLTRGVTLAGGDSVDITNGSQSGLKECPSHKVGIKQMLVKDNVVPDKDNGYGEGPGILVDGTEDSGVLLSETLAVTKSIAECTLGGNDVHDAAVVRHLMNGDKNSNNSNMSGPSSRGDTISYIRTLSDTINQNDIVPVEQS